MSRWGQKGSQNAAQGKGTVEVMEMNLVQVPLVRLPEGQATKGSKEERRLWQKKISVYGRRREAQVQRVLRVEESEKLDLR